LVHEVVEIRFTPLTVEILHKGTRVASHVRSRGRGHAVANHEHRPKSHRAHLEWPPSSHLKNSLDRQPIPPSSAPPTPPHHDNIRGAEYLE